ncbi:zinc ribbon domain-containing protein [uncultured Roseobacter sp.]|uniref:zinc ribbon domain-containing protein n=1 Tax=uncultured Roseobacter sp. TaxID=114847 RepID=UPI00345C775D
MSPLMFRARSMPSQSPRASATKQTLEGRGRIDQKGVHEPLFSLEDWLRVQDVFDGKAMAPRRKDINEDFPLRGFVCCADCGAPMTACWSRSRNGVKHPYYLCAQKSCPSHRKSVRRDDVESAVADVLRRLVPGQALLKLAAKMFKDVWDGRVSKSGAAVNSLKLKQQSCKNRSTSCLIS